MVEEVAALQYRLEASTQRFESAIKRAERQMARSASNIEKQVAQSNAKMERFGERFGLAIPTGAAAATAAIAALGAALRSVVKNGDELRALEGRFKALTDSAKRAGDLTRGVLDISGATGAAVNSVSTLVSRFLIASKEIGATDAQTLKFTQTLVQLGQIGGASANEIANGTTQLAQALAGGVVRAEEFNSIIENTPLIAKAIADALGLSIGQLREMVREGRLTSREVFDAILGKAEETQRKFNELPPSLERATGRMAAAWTKLTAEIDRSTGAGAAFVRMIEGAAKAMEQLRGEIASLPNIVDNTQAAADESRAATLRKSIEAQKRRATETGLDRSATIEALEAELAEIDKRRQSRIKVPASLFEIGGVPPDLTQERMFGPAPDQRRPTLRPLKPMDYGYSASSGGGGGGKKANSYQEAAARILDNYADQIARMDEQRQKIGLTGEALARVEAQFAAARVEQELYAAAAREGGQVTDAQRAEIAALTQQMVEVAIATDTAQRAIEAKKHADEDAKKAAEAHAQAIQAVGDRLAAAATRAQDLKGALKNLALELASLSIQGLFGAGPFAALFKGGVPRLFGFSSPGIGTDFGPGGLYASGAAFYGGRPIPFASGGVVGGPTKFAMAGNRIGLMGEAGPEAILPLARGADGKLGVAARGGGVTINVDARGAHDPAAIEAAARRGAAMALAQVPAVNRDMQRRGAFG